MFYLSRKLFIQSLLSKTVLAAIVAISPLYQASAKETQLYGQNQTLTLERAIQVAQEQDPWLQSNRYRQQVVTAQSKAASTLPDPMVSVSVANLPVDSFDFSQEAMTQLKLGVSQSLPRGDTLALSEKRLQQLSEEFPLQRQDRKAKVRAAISQLWLDIFLTQRTIKLIEQDRPLFEQLVETTSLNYSSAVGQTRQQDVIRAQLELTRLDDRLSQLRQQLVTYKAQLGEWLTYDHQSGRELSSIQLPDSLPSLDLSETIDNHTIDNTEQLVQHISRHPQLLAFEQKVKASNTRIELAEQSYKPQWSLNASYGYRDQDPMGNSRSDFFSVGVSFDMPLFTEQRQDQEVTATIKEREAVKADKWLLLRSMLAQVRNYHGQLSELDKRRQLYRSRLLREMQQQSEATLNAYTNDRGDFTDVMRARIAELNSKIEALTLDINYLKTVAQLNYLLTQAEQ
ncbi:TolC family protein [Kangiella sp.]|uniref:TolC family protein n=1 Tax=Kangiella sp. TaxID=1920245 RepID=UPI0019CABC4F|nr:TolC family protein [Kangiella sp.]MBD3653633.1 TolC family protein [Kangiella sp.]